MFNTLYFNKNNRMPKSVKINKRSNRTVGDKTYWKYSINLPNKIMDELDWDGNTEVNLNVKNNELVVKRKK